MAILEDVYADSDIITLQEVSASFIDKAISSKLGKSFHIIAPKNMDSVRAQNSVIALNRETFPNGIKTEISPLVEAAFPEDEDVPVAKGDILAVTAQSKHGIPFVIASFHGDTNGLATKPVLTAVLKAMASDSKLAGHRLIFGMDANTYEKAKPGKQQDVLDFGEHYVKNGVSPRLAPDSSFVFVSVASFAYFLVVLVWYVFYVWPCRQIDILPRRRLPIELVPVAIPWAPNRDSHTRLVLLVAV